MPAKFKYLNYSRTALFILYCITFISYFTPLFAVTYHGLIGLVPLLLLTLFISLVEGSFIYAVNSILEAISENKWLFLFALWFFLGTELNVFKKGIGLSDWILFLDFSLFFGFFCLTLIFFNDDKSNRKFQIYFIIVSGVQALFAAKVLVFSPGIAREMWSITSGAWIYGNQTYYASMSMLLPVIFWRALNERGFLRTVLTVSAVLITLECLVSSFGTAFGLVVIGIIIVALGSFVIFIFKKKRLFTIAIIIIISVITIYGNKYVRENELFASPMSRMENLLRDPTSGGYYDYDKKSSRWLKGEISLRSFVNNPFFGTGGTIQDNKSLGGHSALLDSLGCYGLFGGGGALVGLIVIMLYTSGKRFFRDSSWHNVLIFAANILLTIGGIVNPYWGLNAVLVLIFSHNFRKKPIHRKIPEKISRISYPVIQAISQYR